MTSICRDEKARLPTNCLVMERDNVDYESKAHLLRIIHMAPTDERPRRPCHKPPFPSCLDESKIKDPIDIPDLLMVKKTLIVKFDEAQDINYLS